MTDVRLCPLRGIGYFAAEPRDPRRADQEARALSVGCVDVVHGQGRVDAPWRGDEDGATIADMTVERLPSGLPRPRDPVASHEWLVEQLRLLAVYLQTAAVLESEGERCRPSPGSLVLCECARRRRDRAAQIRDFLAGQGVIFTRPALRRLVAGGMAPG